MHDKIDEILHWLEAGEVAEARKRVVALRRRWQGMPERAAHVARLLEIRRLLAGNPGARRQDQAWYRLQGLRLAEGGMAVDRLYWG